MAKTNSNNKSPLPAELEGVARIEQVTSLEARVDKAYSKENYKEFKEHVQEIVLEQLEGDAARGKLKDWACGLMTAEATSDVANARMDARIDARIETDRRKRDWKNKQFWIPTAIGLGAIIATLIDAFIKHKSG